MNEANPTGGGGGERLVIDGAHGEGGGQILRTGLALAAILGRTVQFTRIRAGRRRPGLAAQHLTAVRAAGKLCAASLDGDALGSQELVFTPQRPVTPDAYTFDVAAAREGGSAGGASLVLQTVLLPLALAGGHSEVQIQGGTHLPQSPPFDYLRDVWLPVLQNLGIRATIALEAWGWFPVGRGVIRADIAGAPPFAGGLASLQLLTRGPLLRITGRAVAANLPDHIPQRMADRATALLASVTTNIDVRAESVRAACAGAGIFLVTEYQHARAGFSALGARGKLAEQVAEEAVEELLRHHATGATVENHLADQLLLPLSLAAGPSHFTVAEVTRHLETNAWVIEQFGIAKTTWHRIGTASAHVEVTPKRFGHQR
jgi:RNA 3'-terminal phosphate cyclase (ATP)